MAARAALADRVEPVMFIVIAIVIVLIFFMLRHGAAVTVGMLLVIPEQLVLVVLLEILEPRRHFQILIISPEARAEPVALVVTLEMLATTVRLGPPRNVSLVGRLAVVIQHLPLQCPAGRRVAGRALEGPLPMAAAAVVVVVLGPPMPGTVRQISQELLARAGPAVVETADRAGRNKLAMAPAVEHLMYSGRQGAAVAAGVLVAVLELAPDREAAAAEEVTPETPATLVTQVWQQTRILSTPCQWLEERATLLPLGLADKSMFRGTRNEQD